MRITNLTTAALLMCAVTTNSRADECVGASVPPVQGLFEITDSPAFGVTTGRNGVVMTGPTSHVVMSFKTQAQCLATANYLLSQGINIAGGNCMDSQDPNKSRPLVKLTDGSFGLGSLPDDRDCTVKWINNRTGNAVLTLNLKEFDAQRKAKEINAKDGFHSAMTCG